VTRPYACVVLQAVLVIPPSTAPNLVRSATSPSRRSLHTRALPSTVSEFLAAHHRKLSGFCVHSGPCHQTDHHSFQPAAEKSCLTTRSLLCSDLVHHRISDTHVFGAPFRDLPGSLPTATQATRSTRPRHAPALRRDSFKLPHWDTASTGTSIPV
jgi:hypothetical protein